MKRDVVGRSGSAGHQRRARRHIASGLVGLVAALEIVVQRVSVRAFAFGHRRRLYRGAVSSSTMEQDSRRLSDLARILLVVSVLVTAVVTHFLDTYQVFRVEDLTATEMSD